MAMSQGAQGEASLEGSNGGLGRGAGGHRTRGVSDHGMYEEDDPGTWEASKTSLPQG
jgi:hypothetical protein